MKNKLIFVLIGIVVVLGGLVLFLLFPPSIEPPGISEHTFTISEESDFLSEIGKYDITIQDIEDSTLAFYVLASSKTTSETIVYENVKFQINFQYKESPDDHYEVFVYYDEIVKRYYYFSPGSETHGKQLVGYIDYDTDHFHIGHIE